MKREDKKKIIKQFSVHSKDTGSAEVQIAIITKRMNDLSEHLKLHPKDLHSKSGLIKLVGRRRKLLNYVREHKKDSYQKLIGELEIRK